jgi:hypothetical protein
VRECFAELQREVEPLAEQQHDVGFLQYLRKSPEARIAGAARAFHADHRDAGDVLQLAHPLAHARGHQHGADEYQRT